MNSFPHLFNGCSYKYIKNHVACIFHTILSLILQPENDKEKEMRELCSYLAYYRSEYIRLSKDERAGIEDILESSHRNSPRVCRLFIFCYLHLVEIAVTKVGICDADYIFQHLHEHFEQLLNTTQEMKKYILVFLFFIECD